MTTRTRWITVGIAAPAALIAATMGVALTWQGQGRLPSPVATHFGGNGPNGSMPFAASQAVPLGIAFAAIIGGAALCLGAKHGFHQVRATASLVLGITALLGAADLVSLAANLDVVTWRDADLVAWQFVLAILALPIAGAAGWFAFGRQPAVAPAASPRATLGLKPGERAVWTGTASSHGMIVAAALVTAALAVVAVATGHLWLLAVAVVAGLTVAALAEIRVTVDADGVSVRSWLKPIRLRRVPLATIERATAIDVDPLQWGGWGYRALPGRGAAVVLHRGPGLKLDLDGGRAFVVTVSDPETAAGLVNDLARHS